MSRSGVTSPAINGHAPTAAALASRSLCAIHLLIASSLLSDQPSLCEGCHWQCGLLRTRREGPRGCRAAKCDNEFSPSDVGCHATLPWGSCPCNGGDDITL